MLSSFQETCNKIEDDPNFGRSITPLQLRYMASCKLKATEQATVIYSSNKSCDLGRFYNILQVSCTSTYSQYTSYGWSVSAYKVLVSNDGEISFYKGADFKLGKASEGLSLDQFLGQAHVITYNMKELVQYVTNLY